MKNYIVNWKAYSIFDSKITLVAIGSNHLESDLGNDLKKFHKYIVDFIRKSNSDLDGCEIQIEPYLL